MNTTIKNQNTSRKKIRLDKLLIEKKLAETRQKAQVLILSGNVKVNGETISKPSKEVDECSNIEIVQSLKYVSRGGLKLQHALEYFKIDVKNKICLDIGSSTGGFTDCLLQYGGEKIYATDVGKGLLDWKLRNNPKVVVLEGINFRYFPEDLIKNQLDLITIDVSFISLEKILTKVKNISSPKTKILALVKPQFEVERKFSKKGVVKDKKVQIEAVKKIIRFAKKIGFKFFGFTTSPIKGPKGNTEYFILLSQT